MDFLGGPAILSVSDNLKTGILVHRKLEYPIANRTYQELTNHYGMALLPAKALAPNDKATVEGNILLLLISEFNQHMLRADLYRSYPMHELILKLRVALLNRIRIVQPLSKKQRDIFKILVFKEPVSKNHARL